MACDELLRLLNTAGWEHGEDPLTCKHIVLHLRTCKQCIHGMLSLSNDLLLADLLTCEQCRALFPAYYEATRPDFPLLMLPEQQIAAVALHLLRCATCAEEYAELVHLSLLEEQDELPDLS